jgi:hypothetical protein
VVQRFRQEVRAAARLAHPNIVTAYDAGEAGDVCFLVMEYVEGETLAEVVARRGPLPLGEACDYARQAALGLEHAHAQGLVHRDLKPGNLLRTPQGVVKILDFGLARLHPGLHTGEALTPAGAVVGTPLYVAPEQARDPGGADARADLYSLGCTLYHLLAGCPPFPEGTALQQLLAHQDRAPRPLTAYRADVPEELGRLVERLLAKEPERRYQTAADVADALVPFADPSAVGGPAPATGGDATPPLPQAPRSRPGARLPRSALIAAGSVLAAVGVVAVWWWVTGNEPPGEPAAPGHGAEAPKDPPAKASPRPRQGPERWSARPPVRDQVVAWLKADDHFGPDHRFVAFVGQEYAKKLADGRAFLLRLGPGVGYAGRPTLLAGRHHDLLAFDEFTQPQGRRWLEVPGVDFIYGNPQSQEYAAEQYARLSDPRVAGAEAFDIRGRLRGSVAYRKLGRSSGTVALRVTTVNLGPTRTVYRIYWDEPLAEEGRLAFDLDPLIGKEEADPREPAVLFFDLGLWRGQKHPQGMLVLSNTVAVPLLFRQAHAGPQPGGGKPAPPRK